MQNGSYKNIFPGDYIRKDITISGTTISVTFYIAHLDYYGTGCVMYPGTNLTTAVMNSSNTTSGGFIASRMYTVTLPALLTAIRNAFGSTHIAAMNVYFPNSFEGSTGKATGWKDYSVYITLPTECQIYGGAIWSDIGYEMGYETSMLALFRHNKRLAGPTWLRNVSKHSNYASDFCYCNSGGLVLSPTAANSYAVRPLFNLT